MSQFHYTSAPEGGKKDIRNLKRIFPYIWEYKGRVLIALLSLVLSKVAIVGIPLIFKQIIDILDTPDKSSIVIPVSLFILYGAARMSGSLFNEVRDAVFARVRYRAMRRLSNKVLSHLHKLSLRYHLERRTGNVVRDLERGTNSISQILNYLVFNIVPTLAEFILVAFILLSQYEARFALITFSTVAVYIVFTLLVTEWRMHYRHTMNSLDSESNGQAVDSLINYETVKYFNNEDFEVNRYDSTLTKWEDASVKSQTSMSLLNFGQGAIIAVGLTLIMLYAGQGVVAGKMTLGDLVLINTMMLQLFMPLSFLGIIYRMLKHSLADMDMVFKLLDEELEIKDRPAAKDLKHIRGEIKFEHVDFSYQQDREILHDISFTVKPGEKLAIVGHSGSGKSTLARLLFRFYDTTRGHIFYDDQDISTVTQSSLRQAVGIVPQDTVLFNESIFYNIKYAKADASREEVITAARLANIHDFIDSLPEGYDTAVGERGLKLSGGEKQRLAIARVILKGSPILIFDEATSSLDSKSEKVILEALSSVAQTHTTLVIAHRLSTITDSDQILVMDKGRIVEQGTHASLLAKAGLYADMWALQLQESDEVSS
jgi:ATP-binding cassette subfamily B protein